MSKDKFNITEAMLKKRCDAKTFSRSSDYVCSPNLTHRVIAGNSLSCKVRGNYGIYSVILIATGGRLYSKCGCPAEMDFCKHAVALGLTWICDPESFYDLDAFMIELENKPKEELIEAVRDMVESEPSLLRFFGVEGFSEPAFDFDDEELAEEIEDDEDDEDDEENW